MSAMEVCVLGYGLHPPWSEGTRVVTRDQMRALQDRETISVRGISTLRRGMTPAIDLDISYVNESIVGDFVERRGGYRYNRDVPMLGRLCWRLTRELRRRQPEVLHIGFASHTVFTLLNDLVGDAAVVAQTFGGLEHTALLQRIGTPERIDAYVTTSPGDIDALASFGIPDEKCHRLNPAVFLGEFGNVPGAEARRRFDLPDDAFVAGYFGNVNEARFPYEFAAELDSYAASEDVEVLVVTKQIEDRDIRDLPNLTVVTEALSNHDKRLAYVAGDVWMFPFQFESEDHAPVIDPPLTVLEAMATGRPVVATDTLSLSEAIESGGNGYLVAPGEPDRIIERVRSLKNEPSERDRLGNRARETIKSSYSPRAVAESLESIYSEAINSARN